MAKASNRHTDDGVVDVESPPLTGVRQGDDDFDDYDDYAASEQSGRAEELEDDVDDDFDEQDADDFDDDDDPGDDDLGDDDLGDDDLGDDESDFDDPDDDNAEAAPPPVEATSTAPADLAGGVRITLTFDVGEAAVSVEQLRRLLPGYTFELATGIESPVAVRAYGQLIGRGELVQINQRLGVRLLEINHDGH